MRIELKEQALTLLPEKALVWEDRYTLILSDLHLGKATARKLAGMTMPELSDKEDLKRVGALAETHHCERILILGDLIHSRQGLTEANEKLFAEWVESISQKVVLVEGNHDRKARGKLHDLPIEIYLESLSIKPFQFVHEPPEGNEQFAICGHIHPGFQFKDAIGCSKSTKAFWLKDNCLVLPAFGTLTGHVNVKPGPKEKIFLCAEDRVIQWMKHPRRTK